MKPFLFLLVAFLLFSCGKKREIKIIAKNAVTGQPYGGLEYSIVSSKTGLDGEKYRTEASGTLNANGEVLVAIKQRSGRTYSVSVQGPENNCYTNMLVQTFDSPFDQDGTFTFEFAECATLQRKVKNVNCINSNDKIEIYIDNTVHSLLTTPWILNGCADYTTVPTQVPIGNYTLHWIVTKNGISTDYYDSFNLTENEVKLHEINY
ncbi:MAG: hypothetical protein IT221_00020 [Fluviicola sp.]|nr:hypothetical protein [Fluviicola sp.]